MALQLHGRVETVEGGRDLVVERSVRIDVGDLWRWVTEPERTARWYGPWSGDKGVGSEIVVTMTAEEGAPESTMRIEECAPQRGYVLRSTAPAPFDWRIGISVRPDADGSVVSLRHHALPAEPGLREIGAGWEYYLDALVGAVTNEPAAPFEVWLAEIGPRYAVL